MESFDLDTNFLFCKTSRRKAITIDKAYPRTVASAAPRIPILGNGPIPKISNGSKTKLKITPAIWKPHRSDHISSTLKDLLDGDMYHVWNLHKSTDGHILHRIVKIAGLFVNAEKYGFMINSARILIQIPTIKATSNPSVVAQSARSCSFSPR